MLKLSNLINSNKVNRLSRIILADKVFEKILTENDIPQIKIFMNKKYNYFRKSNPAHKTNYKTSTRKRIVFKVKKADNRVYEYLFNRINDIEKNKLLVLNQYKRDCLIKKKRTKTKIDKLVLEINHLFKAYQIIIDKLAIWNSDNTDFNFDDPQSDNEKKDGESLSLLKHQFIFLFKQYEQLIIMGSKMINSLYEQYQNLCLEKKERKKKSFLKNHFNDISQIYFIVKNITSHVFKRYFTETKNSYNISEKEVFYLLNTNKERIKISEKYFIKVDSDALESGLLNQAKDEFLFDLKLLHVNFNKKSFIKQLYYTCKFLNKFLNEIYNELEYNDLFNYNYQFDFLLEYINEDVDNLLIKDSYYNNIIMNLNYKDYALKNNILTNIYKDKSQLLAKINQNQNDSLYLDINYSLLHKFISYATNDKTTIENCENKSNKKVIIRANKPIPFNCPLFYFEMIILSKLSTDTYSIGVVDKDYQHLDAMIGWKKYSIGYHSDDGKLYPCEPKGLYYGPSYGENDIIGFCLDNITSTLFFTLNGKKLDSYSFLYGRNELFPAISIQTNNAQVSVNFGDTDFCFDLNSYKKEALFNLYAYDILNESTSENKTEGTKDKMKSKNKETEYKGLVNNSFMEERKELEQNIFDYLKSNNYNSTLSNLLLADNKLQHDKLYQRNYTVSRNKQIKDLICFLIVSDTGIFQEFVEIAINGSKISSKLYRSLIKSTVEELFDYSLDKLTEEISINKEDDTEIIKKHVNYDYLVDQIKENCCIKEYKNIFPLLKSIFKCLGIIEMIEGRSNNWQDYIYNNNRKENQVNNNSSRNNVISDSNNNLRLLEHDTCLYTIKKTESNDNENKDMQIITGTRLLKEVDLISKRFIKSKKLFKAKIYKTLSVLKDYHWISKDIWLDNYLNIYLSDTHNLLNLLIKDLKVNIMNKYFSTQKPLFKYKYTSTSMSVLEINKYILSLYYQEFNILNNIRIKQFVFDRNINIKAIVEIGFDLKKTKLSTDKYLKYHIMVKEILPTYMHFSKSLLCYIIHSNLEVWRMKSLSNHLISTNLEDIYNSNIELSSLLSNFSFKTFDERKFVHDLSIKECNKQSTNNYDITQVSELIEAFKKQKTCSMLKKLTKDRNIVEDSYETIPATYPIFHTREFVTFKRKMNFIVDVDPNGIVFSKIIRSRFYYKKGD